MIAWLIFMAVTTFIHCMTSGDLGREGDVLFSKLAS